MLEGSEQQNINPWRRVRAGGHWRTKGPEHPKDVCILDGWKSPEGRDGVLKANKGRLARDFEGREHDN